MALSKDGYQRDVQTHMLTIVALAVIALLVIAVPVLGYTIEHSGEENVPQMERPLPGFQLVMGALATVAALRLPWLVWTHRTPIRTVRTVRGLYYQAGVGTAAFAIPGLLTMHPFGPGLVAVGLVSVVATAAVPRIPEDDRVWPSDFRGV